MMKKTIAILLSVVMLLTVVTSLAENGQSNQNADTIISANVRNGNGQQPPAMPNGGSGQQNGQQPPAIPNGGSGQQNGQQPPAMPNGENSQQNGQQPPAMPNGENSQQNGQQPPAMPNGENSQQNGQQPPAMPGNGQNDLNGQPEMRLNFERLLKDNTIDQDLYDTIMDYMKEHTPQKPSDDTAPDEGSEPPAKPDGSSDEQGSMEDPLLKDLLENEIIDQEQYDLLSGMIEESDSSQQPQSMPGGDGQNQPGNGKATVQTGNNNGLRMRKEANKDSKILGTFSNGTEVEILEVGSEWVKVRIGDKTGFMMVKFLEGDITASSDTQTQDE